jgi:plasmid stabilization system protein ParE
MKYRVEFAGQAKSDLSDLTLWIAEDSPADAARWLDVPEAAIHDLDVSPERCALAPENDESEECEVRHLIVGLYRVLFTVQAGMVFVLHVRLGSRRAATRLEIAEAIREQRDLGRG